MTYILSVLGEKLDIEYTGFYALTLNKVIFFVTIKKTKIGLKFSQNIPKFKTYSLYSNIIIFMLNNNYTTFIKRCPTEHNNTY